MQQRLTFDEFEARIRANLEEIENQMGQFDDEDLLDQFLYMGSSCSPEFEQMMAENGLVIDFDSKLITFDPDKFGSIREQAQAVCDEYEAAAGEGLVWVRYGLHGDDDVDYNGGLILMFLDILDRISVETSPS